MRELHTFHTLVFIREPQDFFFTLFLLLKTASGTTQSTFFTLECVLCINTYSLVKRVCVQHTSCILSVESGTCCSHGIWCSTPDCLKMFLGFQMSLHIPRTLVIYEFSTELTIQFSVLHDQGLVWILLYTSLNGTRGLLSHLLGFWWIHRARGGVTSITVVRPCCTTSKNTM